MDSRNHASVVCERCRRQNMMADFMGEHFNHSLEACIERSPLNQ